MPKLMISGRRFTADITHRIDPMIKVKDVNGQEWYARSLFLNLDRTIGDNWTMNSFELSIARKPNYAFYRNEKLGVNIRPDQNHELEVIIDKYIDWVTEDTRKNEG